MIRNIIFDWSGTLVDDLPAVWKATNHVFSRVGLTELSLEQFRAEFCLPFTKFYNRYTPHVPLAQLEEWFHAHFKSVQDSVCELPHARDFLHFCQSQGFRMFVLSTIHRDHYATQSALTGFHAFWERHYIEVWDKRKKIRQILEDNALDPQETLFVGDMEHDIETAKHGGVHSCGVLTGYNALDQLRAAQPDLIVEHLSELRMKLENGTFGHPQQTERPEPKQPVVTVGALIYNRAGQVLMIRTHKWSDRWGIPGGKVQYGEECIAALQREVKEETALDVDNIRLVMVQDCIQPPEFYRDAHFLLLNYTCDTAENQQVQLNQEAQTYRWCTVAEALAMPLNEPTRRLIDAVESGKELSLVDPATQ